jgi:hypothetical protein
MENKSKLNTVLLVIIIVLLVAGLVYFFFNNSKQKENTLVNNLPQENQVPSPEDNNSWVLDSKIGLTYNSSWEITPELYRTPAQQENGEPEQIVGYRFTLPSGNTISWGGHQSGCSQNEFEKFQYGISTVACINAVRSNIGLSNVRLTLPKEDLNSFGDFVLKNQKESTNNSTIYTYSNHGFTIELPKGFTPTETRSENGPSYSISLPTGDLVYVTDSSFWEKYNIPSYTYKEDKKIGDTIFKVYEYSGATFYWYRKGDVGYQFGAINKTGLENLLKTFKFVGWN